MTDTALNPGGAGYFNLIDTGATRLQFVIDPTVGAPLHFGTVVELEDYAGPGTHNPPTKPLIQPSSTTPDSAVIGVVTGGLNDFGLQEVKPGIAAVVTALGLCQVLVDATVAAGEDLIQSPTTAGCANSTASATTRTIGLCLQSVTVSSGTKLAWAFINPGAEGSGGGALPPSSIAGDLTFTTADTGPVIQDQSDGHTYRIISTAGTLSTEEVS